MISWLLVGRLGFGLGVSRVKDGRNEYLADKNAFFNHLSLEIIG